MGVLLYCITAGAAPAAGLEGPGGPVVGLSEPPFQLWVSESAQRPAFDVAAAEAHNRVVAAAMALPGGALPVRFGQWFTSPEELRVAVSEKRAAHEDALRRVAGAEEFGVRVLDPAAADAARDVQGQRPSSGREYMDALAARQERLRTARERAQSALDELRRELGSGVVREARIETLNARVPGGGVLHLVPLDRRAEYLATVEAVRGRHDGLRFLLSGPWPPYSFVS